MDIHDYYVTFGQRYAREPHPTFPGAHPDGYVVIEAADEEAARATAYTVFDNRYAFIYPEPPAGEFAPRGEIGRVRSDGSLSWDTVPVVRYVEETSPTSEAWAEAFIVTVDGARVMVDRYGDHGYGDQAYRDPDDPARPELNNLRHEYAGGVYLSDLIDHEAALYGKIRRQVMTDHGLAYLLQRIDAETDLRYAESDGHAEEQP